MGYGEYGGGGSVHWKVVHGGDGGVDSGRDPLPKRESDGRFNGQFIVVIKGRDPIAVDITGDHDQIQIYWPPHQPGQVQDLQEVIDSLNRRTAATAEPTSS